MQTPKLDEAPEAVVRDAELAVGVPHFSFINLFGVPVLGISQRLVDIIFPTPVVVELVVRQVIKSTKGRRPRWRVHRYWLVYKVGLGGLGGHAFAFGLPGCGGVAAYWFVLSLVPCCPRGLPPCASLAAQAGALLAGAELRRVLV